MITEQNARTVNRALRQIEQHMSEERRLEADAFAYLDDPYQVAAMRGSISARKVG